MAQVRFVKVKGGRVWHRMPGPRPYSAMCKQSVIGIYTEQYADEARPPIPACPSCGRIAFLAHLKNMRT